MLDKISHGVLAVRTDSGFRFIRPSLVQRIRLVWTFRHFPVLPEEVLQRNERRLIDSLCREGEYLTNGSGHREFAQYRIGTVERLNRHNYANPLSDARQDRLPTANAQTILPGTTS
jgi:hypothetical protein